MDKVIDSALKVLMGQHDGSKLGGFNLRLACYLFEPFAKFLCVHLTRKNGFQNFLDKLLGPLLHLLHVLHSIPCDSGDEWKVTIPKWMEEVVAQGLFHPTHIEGFLSLQSSVRYRNSSDNFIKDGKLVNKSYHRHLFDEVEKIVATKNDLAVIGLGQLLHLFVCCVMKQNGISVGSGVPRGSNFSLTTHVSSTLHRSQTMALKVTPSSHNINKYLQTEGELGSALYNVCKTLRSINSVLLSLICDKLYLRTEDTSEGASQIFLRSVHAVLMSLSAKIETSSFGNNEKSNGEVLISLRTELICSINHLLNIEYEVIGDDLESLWMMIFSSATCCYSSMDMPSQPLLSSEILNLSCRLIDVYSDLRQIRDHT
ncbi:hypothetical protein SASPL_128919 [Salvia splendens]|uniref:Uncharacterized protein n=1 Tax=Salvia splendens TaxID=180675 RepID=A0A8X8ZNZ4_SALSN|nr:hypothetical protein SASPL_128919 [Salvia splendens]